MLKDDGRQVMAKAHMAFQARWAKKLIHYPLLGFIWEGDRGCQLKGFHSDMHDYSELSIYETTKGTQTEHLLATAFMFVLPVYNTIINGIIMWRVEIEKSHWSSDCIWILIYSALALPAPIIYSHLELPAPIIYSHLDFPVSLIYIWVHI